MHLDMITKNPEKNTQCTPGPPSIRISDDVQEKRRPAERAVTSSRRKRDQESAGARLGECDAPPREKGRPGERAGARPGEREAPPREKGRPGERAGARLGEREAPPREKGRQGMHAGARLGQREALNENVK